MIQVTFSCEDPTQLAAEVNALHRVLMGSTASNTAGLSAAPSVRNDDQQPNTTQAPAPAAEPAPAKKSRGKNKGAAVDGAADPERPAHLNRAENDFLVYANDGSFVGFTRPDGAAKCIAQRASEIEDVDALDLFASKNEPTLQRMDDADSKIAYEYIQKQYEKLGVDNSADDGNNPAEVTFEDMKAAARAFAEEVGGKDGITAMTALLAEFSLKGLGEVKDKPDMIAKVMKRVTEKRAELKKPAAAKTDDIFG